MKLSTMPKQFAAELLLFLAEHEDFLSIPRELGNDIEVEEVRSLLREVSSGLMQEALDDIKNNKQTIKDDPFLSKQVKNILSHLSSHEEDTLLKAFGLTEDL